MLHTDFPRSFFCCWGFSRRRQLKHGQDWFSQADATTPYWRAPGTAGSLLSATTRAQGSVLREESDSTSPVLLVACPFAPVNWSKINFLCRCGSCKCWNLWKCSPSLDVYLKCPDLNTAVLRVVFASVKVFFTDKQSLLFSSSCLEKYLTALQW